MFSLFKLHYIYLINLVFSYFADSDYSDIVVVGTLAHTQHPHKVAHFQMCLF